MTGFSNKFREQDDKSIGHRPMSGWVTNSKDPLKNQRVQVRVHDLHDEIADEDLPWFGPSQLSAFSGSENIGNHGPVPEVGSKVWINFGDDSQYHGTYGGGVAQTTNQIPEFTNGQKVTLPNGPQYDFSQNYPLPHGMVDTSGSFHGNDTMTDVRTDFHVSGTGHAVDGKGNMSTLVNGDVKRPDNPNAQKVLPTGWSVAVFGNWTVYVSGTITINSIGNVTVATNGDLDLSAQGNINIAAKGGINIGASGAINIESGSLVDINTNSASTPSAVSAQTAPASRTRPNVTLQANDETY